LDQDINQSINQSVKIYIAPLQDTYSEAICSTGPYFASGTTS